MCWFAANVIVDLTHQTYLYDIQQMRMNYTSLIDTIDPTFISLSATAIYHCLSAWTTGKCRVMSEFAAQCVIQCTCDTRINNHKLNNECTDVFSYFSAYCLAFSSEIHAPKMDNVSTVIHWRIDSTAIDPATEQPLNNLGSMENHFHDSIAEELAAQHKNTFTRLSNFVPVTQASVQFSAVLLMGRSANASSSHPVGSSNN